MRTNLKRLLLMCGICIIGHIALWPVKGRETERESEIAFLVGALAISLCVAVLVFVKPTGE